MHLVWLFGLILPSLPADRYFVQSLKCDEATQYAWPSENSLWCCDKCPPGQKMIKRCSGTEKTQCAKCTSGYYLDTYSVQINCKPCNGCSMTGLQHMSVCSTTSDDVCSCKDGFRCKGSPCVECELMPSQTKATHTQTAPITASAQTTPKTASTSSLINPSPQPTQGDTKWILVVLTVMCSLLCCMFAMSKHRSCLQWIGSKHNFWSPQKIVLASKSTEEEVSMPVQEECGKPELLLDV